MKKSFSKPLLIIFITVFIYLLGFGMIIPVLPLLSIHYGATAFEAGLLMSIFSLMQFVFSPFWGRLSDQYGRRPILMYCLLGEAFSYIILAYARSIEMLFLARALTGFFGASISTASAYVSDVTSEKERTKGMAVIGIAFGLGFLFGPAIGGGLNLIAKHYTSDQSLIISFSALPVAVLCVLTFIFAYFFLQETAQKKVNLQRGLLNRFRELGRLFKTPIINKLLSIMSLTSLSMAMMEATLVLFMKDKFNWGITEISFGFAYIGICMILTQGILVRRLVPKMGERFILRMGIAAMMSAFFIISIATNLVHMGLAMTLLSIGNAFVNPTLLGSISLLTPVDQQGLNLGTTQSLSALGRVIGPAFGTLLFGSISFAAPFWTSGILMAAALTLLVVSYQSLPSTKEHAQGAS